MQCTFSELEYSAEVEAARPVSGRERRIDAMLGSAGRAEAVLSDGLACSSAAWSGRMLRLYVMQQCFSLSDEGAEYALYGSHTIRCFLGLDLAREAALDATTLATQFLSAPRKVESHQDHLRNHQRTRCHQLTAAR